MEFFKVWVRRTETAGLLAGGQAGSDITTTKQVKKLFPGRSPEINVHLHKVQGVAQEDGDSWTAC